MSQKIKLLDCTLRDGAYIVHAAFGEAVMKGLLRKLGQARVDIIECGWLKDAVHQPGTSFYHIPSDAERYLGGKKEGCLYCAMVDWNRYDVESLPNYDGKSIDAIRVVFPYGKAKEGIRLGEQIRERGYQVFFQAANTLAYSNGELVDLAKQMDRFRPGALSVVDTFGAMQEEDLGRIVEVLDRYLDGGIRLGFHSHNNQQLSFALSMFFVKYFMDKARDVMVDASLCGMGRGAGNATTELVASFLNRSCSGNYNLDAIMDAIDTYMGGIQENYQWGYSTEYFIAGMYCCHVNNIAYLRENHRANAKDMRHIIESLDPEDRRKYNYGLLEQKYVENQNRLVDDESTAADLEGKLKARTILLIAPGKSAVEEKEKIQEFIFKEHPIVIAVNALLPQHRYDYLFLSNKVRYDYAREAYPEQFAATEKIVLSNVKTSPGAGEWIVNFNRAIKRGWKHFDNAVICCLRLLDALQVKDIVIAGFDGFKTKYNESYADQSLPTLGGDIDWEGLNREIKDIYLDYRKMTEGDVRISFLTESIFATEYDAIY